MTSLNKCLAISILLAACGSDDPSGPGVGGDDQTPPMGATAVEAWLGDGAYKSWAAEAAVHASREPSPHGFNRIFSNDLIAANATGSAAWPKGSASVKELYSDVGGGTPIGVAVYLKLDDDSADGANWYWYERIEGSGVVADGTGDSGTPKSICVGCHAGAGSDAAHTPTVGGRDQVYTPVP